VCCRLCACVSCLFVLRLRPPGSPLFPTRRSSDLLEWSLVDIVGLIADREYIPPATLPATLGGWVASIVAQLGTNFAQRYRVDPRSEEHTSELQSRFELVCRLLLEKKKEGKVGTLI